jgi:hypothetical protein
MAPFDGAKAIARWTSSTQIASSQRAGVNLRAGDALRSRDAVRHVSFDLAHQPLSVARCRPEGHPKA